MSKKKVQALYRIPPVHHQRSGSKRRETQVVLAQKPTQSRSEQEANTHRASQQTEAVGALAWAADVGNVGLRCANVAR